MVTHEQAQAIDAGVLADIVGQMATTTLGAGNPIGVWPASWTTGKRASSVYALPVSNFVFISPTKPASADLGGGMMLPPNVITKLNLDPTVSTLWFQAPADTSISLGWLVRG